MKSEGIDNQSEVSTQHAFDHTVNEKILDDKVIHTQPEGKWSKQYPFFVFLLIGTAQLYGWNAFSNAVYAILTTIYGDYSGKDDINTIVGVSATMNFLFTCLCIRFTRFFARTIVTQVGLIITAADSLLLAAIMHLPYSATYYLLHIFGALMGIANALIGCSAFGYANYFPSNYSGAMSAGLGLSGLLSFIVWMMSKYVIFSNTIEGTQSALWLLNVVSAVLVFYCMFVIHRFFSLPWVKNIVVFEEREKVAQYEKQYKLALEEQLTIDNAMEHKTNDSITNNPENETIWQTFKSIGLVIFLFFITMFITFGTFPGIGPSHFNISQSNRDIATGMFQLGDMIGRYVPNVVPFLLLRKNPLTLAVMLRLIYLVIFLIVYAFPDEQVFLNHMAFQVLLFFTLSFTNGWVFSCCFIRMPEFVTSDIAKARCASIGLLLILLGITVASWTDFGIVLAWPIEAQVPM